MRGPSGSSPSTSSRCVVSRTEKIQDTVVFFGSARVDSRERARARAANAACPGRAAAPTTQYEAELKRVAQGGRVGALLRGRPRARAAAHRRGAMSLARRRTIGSSSRRAAGPASWKRPTAARARRAARPIGLNIRLPFEQGANPYITDGLHFEFHYFFMRKFWFAYLAKALVIFPGGFGTLRRALRDPHARADRQAVEEDRRHPLRPRVLGSDPRPSSRWPSGARSPRRISSSCTTRIRRTRRSSACARTSIEHHLEPPTCAGSRRAGHRQDAGVTAVPRCVIRL